MTDNTYNGWTNRATWLVRLHFEEYFNGYDADQIKDYLEQLAYDQGGNLFLQDLLLGALEEINYDELAAIYQTQEAEA